MIFFLGAGIFVGIRCLNLDCNCGLGGCLCEIVIGECLGAGLRL